MSKLHYLTVQDMLWINLQVVGEVVPFDYARLEDGTYLQYGYGASTDLRAQAARFLAGFAKKQAFERGNEPTGFLAFVAFLRMNGWDVAKPDAEAGGLLRADEATIAAAIVERADHGHHEAGVAETVRQAMEDFPLTLASLTPAAAA